MVRIVCMALCQTWDFKNEWVFGHEMGRIGQWLAQGQGFTLDGVSPSAKFPPIYPFLVGGFFSVFGIYSKASAVGLFLFQSLCSAGIAICLVVVGNHVFGRTTGLIAGWAWAFYPTSIFYSAIRIWYSELAVLLLMLSITIAYTSRQSKSSRRIAILGALGGFTVLTDSTMALYLPLLLLWMLLARRVQVSRLVFLVALWGLTAGVVTSPWMMRNWLAVGSLQPLKSNFGLELFKGNSPFSSGINDRDEVAQTFAALNQKELAYYRSQSEVVYYHYLRDKALDWIREHPFGFLSLTVQRIWYFWIFNPGLGWESGVRLAYFGLFIMLALCGLRYATGRRRHLAPIWLFLLIYPLPYYLTHVTHGRYSYPVEPLVVLLAANSVAVWVGSLYDRRRHSEYEAMDRRADNPQLETLNSQPPTLSSQL
jgi:hypothetical protein